MRKPLKSIQMLRALAVILVALHHLTILNGLFPDLAIEAPQPLFNNAFLAGYGGIDLFFVISGLILIHRYGHLPQGRASIGQFLIGRAARIYPSWWLALAAMMVCYLIAYGTPYNPEHATELSQTSGNGLLASALLLPSGQLPLLSVGWPLIHLVYLSLGYALLLALPMLWRLLAIFSWTLLVLWGALRGLSSPMATSVVEVFFHPLSLEFLGGMIVGILLRARYAWSAVTVTIIGVFWFAIASQSVGPETDGMRMWGRVAYFGIPSILMVWGFSMLERDQKLFYLPAILLGGVLLANWVNTYPVADLLDLAIAIAVGLVGFSSLLLTLSLGILGLREIGARQPIRLTREGFRRLQSVIGYVGDLSYTLYLCHLPIFFLTRRVWPVLPSEFQAWNTSLFAIVSLALSGLVAALLHSFFEKPVLSKAHQIRQRLSSPAQRPAIDHS